MRALASLCVCVCRLSLAAMCLCHLLRQLAVFVSRCVLVFELFTRSSCMLRPFLSACVCVCLGVYACVWVGACEVSARPLCVSCLLYHAASKVLAQEGDPKSTANGSDRRCAASHSTPETRRQCRRVTREGVGDGDSALPPPPS